MENQWGFIAIWTCYMSCALVFFFLNWKPSFFKFIFTFMLRKSIKKMCYRRPAPAHLILYAICAIGRSNWAMDTNTEFYLPIWVSWFVNISEHGSWDRACHISIQWSILSLLKYVLYHDYAPAKDPVINSKPARSPGHLVITAAALPLVIVLQLRQVNGKMFFKRHKRLIVQYRNETHWLFAVLAGQSWGSN